MSFGLGRGVEAGKSPEEEARWDHWLVLNVARRRSD